MTRSLDGARSLGLGVAECLFLLGFPFFATFEPDIGRELSGAASSALLFTFV
jgi:hypothetical protein